MNIKRIIWSLFLTAVFSAPCLSQYLQTVSLTTSNPTADIACQNDLHLVLHEVTHPEQSCVDEAYLVFSQACIRQTSCQLTASSATDCDLAQQGMTVTYACVESSQIVDICDKIQTDAASDGSAPFVYVVSDKFPSKYAKNRKTQNCQLRYNAGEESTFNLLYMNVTARSSQGCYDRISVRRTIGIHADFQAHGLCGSSVATPESGEATEGGPYLNIVFEFSSDGIEEKAYGFVLLVRDPGVTDPGVTEPGTTTNTGGELTTTSSSPNTGECTSFSCQNSGTCSSSGGLQFTCTCTAEYTGPNCEYVIAELNQSSRFSSALVASILPSVMLFVTSGGYTFFL